MRPPVCLETQANILQWRGTKSEKNGAQLHRCESLKSRPHSVFIESEDNQTCNDWNISRCSVVQNKGKLFCRLCNILGLQYLYSTGKVSNYGFVCEYFAENLQTGEIEMAVKRAPYRRPPPPTPHPSRFAPVKSRAPQNPKPGPSKPQFASPLLSTTNCPN